MNWPHGNAKLVATCAGASAKRLGRLRPAEIALYRLSRPLLCSRTQRCLELLARKIHRAVAEIRAPPIGPTTRFRALLIAAGYEDGNDRDALRADPAFKMAVGRLPEAAPSYAPNRPSRSSRTCQPSDASHTAPKEPQALRCSSHLSGPFPSISASLKPFGCRQSSIASTMSGARQVSGSNRQT